MTSAASPSLTILTAMVTPAVLILACGSLILTTSQRQGRVIERARKLSERLAQLSTASTDKPAAQERPVIFRLVELAARRARLLQLALASLYIALALFVGASMSIAIIASAGRGYAWVPAALAIAGIGLVFCSTTVLIVESRLAVASVNHEMDFVVRLGRQHARPALEQPEPQRASARS